MLRDSTLTSTNASIGAVMCWMSFQGDMKSSTVEDYFGNEEYRRIVYYSNPQFDEKQVVLVVLLVFRRIAGCCSILSFYTPHCQSNPLLRLSCKFLLQ